MNQSPYEAVAQIPFIKSPSLRVPRPVELPPDIHPLPESINAYFVYPFTLEPHVVTLETSRRRTIAAHAARREAYLHSRDDDKERRKRDALKRIAPGFEPHGGPLVPTRNTRNSMTAYEDGEKRHEHPQQQNRSVMDDLVDQLAALDTATSSSYHLS